MIMDYYGDTERTRHKDEWYHCSTQNQIILKGTPAFIKTFAEADDITPDISS